MKKLLSVEEVLDLLGDVHLNTFYRLCQRDETFPARKIAGKYKVHPDELEAWIKNQPTFIEGKTREQEQMLMSIAKRPGKTATSVTKTLRKIASR